MRAYERVSLPVIGQQSIAEHEPSALVTFNVVSPFKEPAFVRVGARSWCPARWRGRGTLALLAHPPAPVHCRRLMMSLPLPPPPPLLLLFTG